MLPKSAVEEWKTLYQKEFSKDLSVEEATVLANRMFHFLKTITAPIKSKKL